MIRMAMMNMVPSAMGILPGFSSGGVVGKISPGIPYKDYSSGGYTGAGGKYEAAGVVHKSEVVFSQVDVARHGGVQVVEALRLQGKMLGYSNGGIVGATGSKPVNHIRPMSPPQKRSSTGGDITINTTLNYEGKPEDDGNSAKAVESINKNLRESVRRILRDEMRPGAMLYR